MIKKKIIKETPTVSVIIPVFNAEEYISDCLESIITQTYKNMEIIVVNDGSTDDTQLILNQYVNKDSRIRIINIENSGIANALNVGINDSKAEYIARMDADDIALVDRIERQMRFMIENPTISVVSSAYTSFTENDGDIQHVSHPSDSDIIRLLLCYCCPIAHPAVLAKSSVMKAFPYSSTKASEDHALWCEIIADHKISNIQDSLLKYRKHDKSLSKQKLRLIRMSILESGFKNFLRSRKEIKKIKYIDLKKNRIIYPKLRWWPAYLFWLTAKIFI